MNENPNTPSGSMQRALSQGGTAAIIAWTLQTVLAHNQITMPVELVLAVSTGISTIAAGLWRRFVIGA